MKTMMSLDGATIKRVSDEEASKLFNEEGFRYVAKSMWKEQVRDIDKIHDKVEDGKLVSEKSNKISKAQKRHARKSN